MSRFLNSALRALTPYTPGEQPRDAKKLIKLNTNESPFAPSPAVFAALNANETEKLRLYSDPQCTDFLAALAQTYGVSKACVFAGNGSDEVLAFAFRAFCENGAAFADITYGFYPVFARLFGIAYQEIPLRDDFTIEVADYASVRGTIFLANPNAPTGLCLPLAQIEALLQQNRDRLIVVDEAYVDFGGESAVMLLPRYDNLLVVGTFSKSRSLAGARLGYAIGGDALIADLNTVKFSFNPYNINCLTLLAGTAALADAAYFTQCCDAIVQTRAETSRALAALGFTLTDSRANFLFAAPCAPLGGQAYYQALRERGILVRWFDLPRIRDYVRITIGTDAQMQTLLAVTQEIIKGGIPV